MPDRAEEIRTELRRREIIAELQRRQGGDGSEQSTAAPDAVSPLATVIQRVGQTIPFVPQLASAGAALVDPARREATFGERYAAAREALQARAAAGSAQNPVAGAAGSTLGIGGQILAGGGAALLRNPAAALAAVRSGVIGLPALLRNLPQLAQRTAQAARSAETLSAIAHAAPVGAGYGLGLSNADIPLARGQFGEAAGTAAKDAAVGALTSSGLAGVLGSAAGRNLTQQRAALAQRAPVEMAQALEEAGAQAASGNISRARAFEAARAQVREQNQKLAASYKDAVAQAKQVAKDRTVQLRRAAVARAEAPLESRSLATLGLDSARGQNLVGGPIRAAQAGPELANTQVPGLGRTYGQLAVELADEPVKNAKVIQEVRNQIGQRIGAVRTELAATKAKVPVQPILDRLDAELAKSAEPRELRVQAAEAVRGLLEKAKGNGELGVRLLDQHGKPIVSQRAGQLTAGQLRKFIEDTEDGVGFATAGTDMHKLLGDKADGILLAARDAAVTAEKGLVAAFSPGKLQQYTDDIGAYRAARLAEFGAAQKVSRFHQAEGAAIRRPKPDRVEPVSPVLPQRPAAVAEPAAPVPSKPPRIDAQLRRAENRSRDALAETGTRGFVRSSLPGLGAALGSAGGFALGGVAGGAGGASAGAALGRGIAQRFLKSIRPTRAQFLVRSDAILAALDKHSAVIAAAERAGPRAANAIHRALFQRDPEYRKAFEEGGTGHSGPQTFDEFVQGWAARRGRR